MLCISATSDDPNSNVSRLLREQRNFRMHAELGTDPGFHYLYGKANDPENEPDASAPGSLPGGQLRTRGVEPSATTALGLEGGRQFHLRRYGQRAIRLYGAR